MSKRCRVLTGLLHLFIRSFRHLSDIQTHYDNYRCLLGCLIELFGFCQPTTKNPSNKQTKKPQKKKTNVAKSTLHYLINQLIKQQFILKPSAKSIFLATLLIRNK